MTADTPSRHAHLAGESRACEGWEPGKLDGHPFAGDEPIKGRAAELDEDESPVRQRHRHA